MAHEKCFRWIRTQHLTLSLVVLLGILAGEANAQHLGLRTGAVKAKLRADVEVQPHGSFVRRFQALQADKAEASDFVVFLNEWFEGGTQLGPFGVYHINQIAQRLPTVPFLVMVQPQADSALNEKRRQVVVAALLGLGVADAETRVVIAYPDAEGIRYEDIERVWTHSLFYHEAYGVYGQGAYGGYGGYGGYRAGWGGGWFGGRGFGWGGARPIIFGY
jgi:hypothetical protein